MSAKTMMLVGALALACAAFAADTSNALFLHVRPESSSFWKTAASNVVTLPITYPEGASTATLTVTGAGYEQAYAGITTDAYELTLPAATTPGTENTYVLTLSFDKGESVSAQLSVLAGLEDGAAGTTRCLSSGRRTWGRSQDKRMTLPIPCGTTSLTLNDEEVETGLDGAQGFCTVSGLPARLVLAVGATTNEVTVVQTPGCLLFLR